MTTSSVRYVFKKSDLIGIGARGARRPVRTLLGAECAARLGLWPTLAVLLLLTLVSAALAPAIGWSAAALVAVALRIVGQVLLGVAFAVESVVHVRRGTRLTT